MATECGKYQVVKKINLLNIYFLLKMNLDPLHPKAVVIIKMKIFLNLYNI